MYIKQTWSFTHSILVIYFHINNLKYEIVPYDNIFYKNINKVVHLCFVYKYG